MNQIDYRHGNQLDLDQVIELYHASTLGERRPVKERATMKNMVEHANLVITAWDGALLVGIARAITDFAYVGYLADLAVCALHQQRGIDVELIRQIRAQMGPDAMLVLLAAHKAVDYYPKIGFTQHGRAWTLHASAPPARSRLTDRNDFGSLSNRWFSLDYDGCLSSTMHPIGGVGHLS